MSKGGDASTRCTVAQKNHRGHLKNRKTQTRDDNLQHKKKTTNNNKKTTRSENRHKQLNPRHGGGSDKDKGASVRLRGQWLQASPNGGDNDAAPTWPNLIRPKAKGGDPTSQTDRPQLYTPQQTATYHTSLAMDDNKRGSGTSSSSTAQWSSP